MTVEGYQDVKVGDMIECFKSKRSPPPSTSSDETRKRSSPSRVPSMPGGCLGDRSEVATRTAA